jgi:alcohol dehydrogenase
MKMQAAVLREQGKPRPYATSLPMTIETVDLDPPGPGEVLYKIIGAGLCHSDLSTIENLRPRKLPTIPGHEAAGIVEDVGPGITGLKPGDHVISVFVTSCNDCRYCNGGRPNLCQSSNTSRTNGTLISGARRLSLNGEPIYHYSGLSVFAQYAVVSQNALIRIPDDVPLADASIFGCAVVTGVGAVLNTARVPPGGQMAVVGLGGVGMNALLGGVVAGAERIVAIDLNADKLRIARDLGATDTFLAGNADVVEEIRQATGGGLDFVIETAGSIPATPSPMPSPLGAVRSSAPGCRPPRPRSPTFIPRWSVTGKASWDHIWAVVFRSGTFRASSRCTNVANCRCRNCAQEPSPLTRSTRVSIGCPTGRYCVRSSSPTAETRSIRP